MHEVVVTGYGIVSPLGIGIPEFSQRMFAGESGVCDIRGGCVASNFPIAVGAPVGRQRLQEALYAKEQLQGLLPPDSHISWRFAALAVHEALTHLPRGAPIGAIVCGAFDGLDFDFVKEACRDSVASTSDWNRTRSCLDLLNGIVSLNGNGVVPEEALIQINNGCVTGNQAIAIALQRIRRGRWTRALVGAVDARCVDHNLMNFHLLGAVTTSTEVTASRPFSKFRSGFVRGEGAAALILESREAAESRGAKIFGCVAGCASTSDAYRLTDGRPDGKPAAKAMELAIRDAGCSIDEISAISAHGTSTKMNDNLETAAIKQVFGERAYEIPVTALKSQIGHSTIASGMLEAVACLLMLQEQKLAPTINYHAPDPACDLDYVPNVSRPLALETILSNSFGFGGQNTCAVFKRYR